MDLHGKSLLHLQCHFGMDTISFNRLGVDAVGVDFSENAIKLARELNDELNLSTEFIVSDVMELDLNRQFDVVFTSDGVLPWLPDLNRWTRVVKKHLKIGGIFYIKDSHPILHTLYYDAETPENLKIKYSYFSNGRSFMYDKKWTYAHDGTDKHLSETIHYEWQHSLSDIINALIRVGLRIIHLSESPYGFFQQFDFMERDEKGRWVLPDEYRDRIPFTFTLVATL